MATALRIEVESDGVFLFRLSAEGQFSGDTWHPSIEEAQQQAAFEFGQGLSSWITVPRDIEDMVAYV